MTERCKDSANFLKDNFDKPKNMCDGKNLVCVD